MARRLVNLTLDNLDDLPDRCRRCVFWELDPLAARTVADPAGEKESWVSTVLLEWGSCGRVLYVDDEPAAYVLFAPPTYVPRAAAFGSAPVGDDAVLLMTARVVDGRTGGGLGRVLAQAVVKDMLRRGARAVEAFGDLRWDESSCVLPAQYLLAVGFKTVRPHPRFPRLRLEMKSAVSWRDDMESALGRLLTSMSKDGALRPV
jgi:hypothetical protein